jgi:hypothetical protein
MKKYALAEKFVASDPAPWNDPDQYYSVEIFIPELGVVYQYKIWETESIFISILVKENSELLHRIKTGYRAKMKYYSTDLSYPYQTLATEIRDIVRQDYGRLKGHYLVGLEILERENKNQRSYSIGHYETEILNFGCSL